MQSVFVLAGGFIFSTNCAELFHYFLNPDMKSATTVKIVLSRLNSAIFEMGNECNRVPVIIGKENVRQDI